MVAEFVRHYSRQGLNPIHRPPARPPVRQVALIYGANLPTMLHTHFRQFAANISEVLNRTTEEVGGKFFSSHHHRRLPQNNSFGFSGDGTVPYGSLRWAHEWHMGEKSTRVVPASTVEFYVHLLGQWGEREVFSLMNVREPRHIITQSIAEEASLSVLIVSSLNLLI